MGGFLVHCEEVVVSVGSSLVNVISDFAKGSVREIFASLVVFADEFFLLGFC